jgi:hypothetical protein
MLYDNYLQLYCEGRLYSTSLTCLSFLCTSMSLTIHHASWHAFHHIKQCIIYLRVVYTRVRRFMLNKCWGGWCWSIFEKVSSTSGVGEGHPSMVLVSSIREVGAKSDFCDLSVELTFSATKASPGHTTTLLFINAWLHLKSSVMCIKLVGVGRYRCCMITLIYTYI